MKTLLLAFSILMLAVSAVFAQIYDRGVTRQNNLANPFIPQQKTERSGVKMPDPRVLKQKMLPRQKVTVPKQKIRPGRNVDNPAAYRFGDISRPNSYVPDKYKKGRLK